MSGEFDFIHWLRAQQKPSDFVPIPAGDDLAVLNWPAADLLVVGVDQVLDGVHFDSSVHSPRTRVCSWKCASRRIPSRSISLNEAVLRGSHRA